MKKLLIILIFSGFAFAQRYPMIVEFNYLKGCVGDREHMQQYCICTLKEIENEYTLEGFINLLKNREKSKQVINQVAKKCIYKLKSKEK